MQVRSFWTRLDRFPPILIRLLARLPRSRALESTEIAERSGLSVIQVEAISQQVDWRGVDAPTVRAFMLGCRCDITDRITYRRTMEYLRRQPRNPVSRFRYLQASDKWATYYLPLMKKFIDHIKRNG